MSYELNMLQDFVRDMADGFTEQEATLFSAVISHMQQQSKEIDRLRAMANIHRPRTANNRG